MFTHRNLVASVLIIAVSMGGLYMVFRTESEDYVSARTVTESSSDVVTSELSEVVKEDEGDDTLVNDVYKAEEKVAPETPQVKADPAPVSAAPVLPVSVPEAKPTEAQPQEPMTVPVTPSGYTKSEVSLHASKTSCWTIVGDSVYDVTAYVDIHPGGEKKILRICGIDGTSAFEGQHGGDMKPEKMLAKYRIGALVK